MAAPASERLHATSVAIHGQAVLIEGPPGSGKSDLALRLIDRGATLIADDRTLVTGSAAGLTAHAPERLAGRIEVRGVGIATMPYATEAPVALLVALDPEPPRLPEPARRRLAGIETRVLTLDPRPASAPIKVELALAQPGLEEA